LTQPSGGDGPADHVFVVGVSRSGTTLLRHILNRHSQVAVCPESNYLGNLLPWEGVRATLRRQFGDLRDDEQVVRLVQFLYGGGLDRSSRWRPPSRLWTWLVRQVPEEEVARRLLASDRSDRALFSLIMTAYAEAKGKPVKGEKTPAHIRQADILLAWFPAGRIVHMMRDPRAIYVSELRRRRQSPGSLPYRILRRIPGALPLVILAQVTLAWSEASWRGGRAMRRHPGRYLIVRFEDLVSRPEEEVRAISTFLGLEFEPGTLEQEVVSQGTRLGEAGFDSHAASRWRSSLPGWVDAWFRILLGGRLRRFGYE
jgi:hypothetical protein